MSELHPEVEIREDQAEAIARGLFAVARADGQVHEREAALIAEFFASASDHAASLGALERAPNIDGETLAQLLPSQDLRELFIKTAYLVAYVDNMLGAGESEIIGKYAAALGISAAELPQLETQVKEYLLSHLSHLTNVEAAAEVAKRLKI